VTREYWETHVKALAASGLTAAEYAAKSGVPAGTLSAWKSKLKIPPRAAKVPPPKFVEVKEQVPVIAPPEAGVIELVIGEVRVVIRGRVEADALTPILAAVGARR
jgi:hypothetical protein